jgi:predicted Fe-Mo cluster-binding NifX family protein
MKVIIPATELDPSLDSHPAEIFGNSKSFIIYDTNKDKFYSVENTFYGAKDINIAKDLFDLGIDNVIAEQICVACLHNLNRVGIEVWSDDNSHTIREAYQKFILGGLFVKTSAGGLEMHKEFKKISRKSLIEALN